MHPRQQPDDRLHDLARLQAGVLSLEQAAALGLGRHGVARLVREGEWQRLDRQIYFTSRARPDWSASAWAGLLLSGPSGRLAGRSAAYLHRLITEEPWPLELLVPHVAPIRSRPPWVFHRERPGVRDARSPGNPARTTVEDTVLDLTEQVTAAQTVGWVTDAVQKRLTTVPRLRAAAQRRPRLRHRALLDGLLADVAAGAQSSLEVAYLRDVERAHGLPRANRQRTAPSAQHIRDVYYDDYATVVELDGLLGHQGSGRLRDMARDNATTLAGEATLRYGWHDVADDHCPVAFQVGAVLARRGWTGMPTRCRHCRELPLELLVGGIG